MYVYVYELLRDSNYSSFSVGAFNFRFPFVLAETFEGDCPKENRFKEVHHETKKFCGLCSLKYVQFCKRGEGEREREIRL